MSEYTIRISEDAKNGGRENARSLTTGQGASLFALLKMNGYTLSCCSGKGGCGKCRVRYLEGDAPAPTATERHKLSSEDLAAGVRLACMCRVQADCHVRVEFVH